MRTVLDNPDIFFVFQQVVEAIDTISAATFGFDPVSVQPGDDFPVTPAAGISIKYSPDNLRLCLINGQALFVSIQDYLIAKGGLPSGVLLGSGHVAHFFHHFLACLQDPHLVKNRHITFHQKVGRVPEVFADHRLCDGNNLDPHFGEFIPEGEPGCHFPEHPALIVDHHCVRFAGTQVLHHLVILRPGIFHAADGVVCIDVDDGIPVLLAPFRALFDLDFDAVRILIIRGVSGEDVSFAHGFAPLSIFYSGA